LKERIDDHRSSRWCRAPAIPDDVTTVIRVTNAVDAPSHDREFVIRRHLTCVSARIRERVVHEIDTAAQRKTPAGEAGIT
jgi:hypothetical protein